MTNPNMCAILFGAVHRGDVLLDAEGTQWQVLTVHPPIEGRKGRDTSLTLLNLTSGRAAIGSIKYWAEQGIHPEAEGVNDDAA